jgi:isoleucyl-tRNA synthetase
MKSKTDRECLDRLKPQILEELNVKDIEFADVASELERPGYVALAEGDVCVGVCAEISAELEMEGMAREVVHRIQTMRKSAGFEIADHITTFYEGDDYIQQVMQDPVSAQYIKQETLSEALSPGVPQEGVYSENFKLNGHAIKLGVKKKSQG